MSDNFPTKQLVRVNGCGEAIDGYVAPDSELINLRCENCHDITPFIKMIGVVRKYLFWIPLKAIGEEFTYWQCNYCNRYIIRDTPNVKHYEIPGEKGGLMRDLTDIEKVVNLREMAGKVINNQKTK